MLVNYLQLTLCQFCFVSLYETQWECLSYLWYSWQNVFLIFFVSAKWMWMLSGCWVGKLSFWICIHHAQPFLKTLEHLWSWLSFDVGALFFSLDVGHRTHTMSNDGKTLSQQLCGAQLLLSICLCHACFSPKLHLASKWLHAPTLSVGQRMWSRASPTSLLLMHPRRSSCWAFGHCSWCLLCKEYDTLGGVLSLVLVYMSLVWSQPVLSSPSVFSFSF